MGAERDDPLFSCQGPFQMLLALNGNRGTNPFLGAMKGAGSLINALGEVSPGPPHYDLSLLQGGEFLPHSQGQILSIRLWYFHKITKVSRAASEIKRTSQGRGIRGSRETNPLRQYSPMR